MATDLKKEIPCEHLMSPTLRDYLSRLSNPMVHTQVYRCESLADAEKLAQHFINNPLADPFPAPAPVPAPTSFNLRDEWQARLGVDYAEEDIPWFEQVYIPYVKEKHGLVAKFSADKSRLIVTLV